MNLNFLTIIQVYQLEGMVALGKMLNPATNELSKNLDHAKYVIDLLDILQEKTKGNLTDDEQRFLENTSSTLKLNFVDETGPSSNDQPAELD